MIPRVVLVGIVVVFVLMIWKGPSLDSVYSYRSMEDKPNILFIVTDDQSLADMDAKLPNGEYVMKNVRELIKDKGVEFTQSYVSFALCCPSRATTYTGQYAHNHGVLSNEWPTGGYLVMNHSNTLPMWLQQAGYYTAHLGKYLNGYDVHLSGNGYPPPPPGWSKWFTFVDPPHAYYNFKVFDGQGLISFLGEGYYKTDVLTRETLKFLQLHPYGDRPFFLKLDYTAPHFDGTVAGYLPIPAPRHLGDMNGTPLPTPPNFNEMDVSDKPLPIRNRPLLTSQNVDDITLNYHRRMETLLAVDEGIGQIIQKLMDTGQYANTIIIFTSDNGYMLGEHRIIQGKSLPYEPIRVPLYVSGKGIRENTRIDKMAVNVDLAPTILDWAGARPGLPQDGRSLTPLMENPTISWRRDFLIENPIDEYTGLRIQEPNGNEYLYTEWDYDPDGSGPLLADGQWDEREFYKLSPLPDSCLKTGDPYQLESQHNNACYSNKLQQMHNRLMNRKNCQGLRCQ